MAGQLGLPRGSTRLKSSHSTAFSPLLRFSTQSNGPVSVSVVASSCGPIREGHIAILPPALPQDRPCSFLSGDFPPLPAARGPSSPVQPAPDASFLECLKNMDGSPLGLAEGNNVRCRSEPRIDPAEGLEPKFLNSAHTSAPAPSCTLSGEIQAIPVSTPLVDFVTSRVHYGEAHSFPKSAWVDVVQSKVHYQWKTVHRVKGRAYRCNHAPKAPGNALVCPKSPSLLDAHPADQIGHIDVHLLNKALATTAASSKQLEYLQPNHMAIVSKDNQAVLDQPLPLLGQEDKQLHSLQPESLDMAIIVKDTLIPPNNYVVVLQDSVDLEEPVDFAKEWKTTREYGMQNDEESFFVSDNIELSRSRMNSQLPPLDAAMEKGLVVARGSVLQPPSMKPAAEVCMLASPEHIVGVCELQCNIASPDRQEVVVSSEDASTDLRGPSCSREYVTSLHDLQEED